jgi:hypothetical protein
MSGHNAHYNNSNHPNGPPPYQKEARLIVYNEPLNDSELTFLINKEQKERKQYFTIFKYLMIGSFVFPFIGSWYRAYEGAPNAFSFIRFFVSTFILLTISILAVYISYRTYHRKIRADTLAKTKTIETSRITKKVIVPSKNACYFYTTSPVKLSIEVSRDYFDERKEGDEVSIEYTTNAHLYLGYF